MTGGTRRLPLVFAEDQLTQSAPADFERVLRASALRGEGHKGALRTVLELAKETVKVTLPPSLASELDVPFAALEDFLSNKSDEKLLRSVRSLLFSRLAEFDEKLVGVLEKSGLSVKNESPPLEAHAAHVTLRYASLATYFTFASVCHLLDGAEEPSLVLESIKDQLGARTYLRTGFGAARHPEFLARAVEQANFEQSRPTHVLAPSNEMLALQIFHEFLGARFRAIASEERASMDAFLSASVLH